MRLPRNDAGPFILQRSTSRLRARSRLIAASAADELVAHRVDDLAVGGGKGAERDHKAVRGQGRFSHSRVFETAGGKLTRAKKASHSRAKRDRQLEELSEAVKLTRIGTDNSSCAHARRKVIGRSI